MSAVATRQKEIHVAIAGNPNCGKSTLFNALTGLRQKVGNYPGVTVERKIGHCRGTHGELMSLLDLPGSYSLQVRSPDEAVARDVLLGHRADTPRPDVIVCVVDASNLERNLYLVAQILELKIPVVIALNMIDVAEKQGLAIDVKALSEALGTMVIPTVATTGTGLTALKQALSLHPLSLPFKRAPLPMPLGNAIASISKLLDPRTAFPEALLLLTQPDDALLNRSETELLKTVKNARAELQRVGIDPFSAPIEARYDWVQSICKTCVRGLHSEGLTISDRLDAVLTHPIWGWAAFLGVMTLMFFCIFTVAAYPMEWIDNTISFLADFVNTHLPESDFRSLLADGVIAGVGGVIIFLPQILVLFFFLGLLEDSGYMARAAFIMDRLMSKVGLHGKSFIPLLSSFACAIPGIMATRTIENPKDRLVTILIAPLMSCSARLPVYTLMIALLLPVASTWKKAGIMLAMYLLGIITAFGMAWIFKRTLLKGENPMLLLEMPPYRCPSAMTILIRMWERALIFLGRAGTVILALSILLWALATYPKPASPETEPGEAIAQSFAGKIGHVIEPIIAPLGYDWKIGIGLLASFAAREVFVGTMSIVYNLENADETSTTLRETMLNEKHSDGSPVFTPLVCIGLMVFYVLAMQCISTVAIVRRETNSWRWPLLQIAYMTILAYIGALLVYQVGRLIGFS